jgi:putative oxygen-independent coproporphyrinogen III oxidase
MSGNKIALYIHLPWCIKRCPYCDFNAHQLKTNLPEREYIFALEQDIIESLSAFDAKYEIISIFFGGGTPSLFSGSSIYKILSLVAKYFTINKRCEITLEANPGTLDNIKLQDFRVAGINRLSLGVQSFNDILLKKLGRIHTSMHATKAIDIAKKIDFNSINIDLMHGLPGQTKVDAMSDLQFAISADIPHISWYELTIEPNTYFAKYPPKRVDSDTRAEWMQAGRSLLANYNHYEISAFAKKNYECIHNSWIWEFGDYLGIGAGAHSKITTRKGIKRSVKHKHPNTYLTSKSKFAESIIVNEQDIAFEYFLNRLRLLKPISWQEIQQHTIITNSSPQIQVALQNKWLETTKDYCQLTPKGRWFLDDVVSLFLAD